MTTDTHPEPTDTAEGQTQTEPGAETASPPQSPTPAAVPYPAFKARMAKRDARIKALEQEVAVATRGHQALADELDQARPDAQNWRSYQAARKDMLKEQVPEFLSASIDSQPLSEAETIVAEFLKETEPQPGTDSRRPSSGAAVARLKPLATMTSQEHRDTHSERLSQYL